MSIPLSTQASLHTVLPSPGVEVCATGLDWTFAWSRIDFNTQEDHAASDKPMEAEGDSSAQRLKEAVSSIFSVSGAPRSHLRSCPHAVDSDMF